MVDGLCIQQMQKVQSKLICAMYIIRHGGAKNENSSLSSSVIVINLKYHLTKGVRYISKHFPV